MNTEIRDFILSADMDQLTSQRRELRSEINLGLLNKEDYKTELHLIDEKLSMLGGSLFRAAYLAANIYGKEYLIYWILNNWEILAIHKTTSNWFYIETRHKEETEIYYQAISQCSDCKSTGFGNREHFVKCCKDVTEIIRK
jgi:hypothetical protein